MVPVVLKEAIRTSAHMADKSACLPHLQLEGVFLCGTLTKLDAHAYSANDGACDCFHKQSGSVHQSQGLVLAFAR